MGAGKTSIGKLLAKRLKLKFYDSDKVIEKRTGVKIIVIFDIEGEKGFRNREEIVINEITKGSGQVIATGGGVVLSEKNRQILRNRGLVIYLKAKIEDLTNRVLLDKNRPLLNGDKTDVHNKLNKIFKERDHLYRKVADIIFSTEGNSIHFVTKKLEAKIKEQLVF